MLKTIPNDVNGWIQMLIDQEIWRNKWSECVLGIKRRKMAY